MSILSDFKNLSETELKQKYKTEKEESRDKKTSFAKQNIQNFGMEEKYLQQIAYRPFETKWTYFTNKSKGFLAYPVYGLMQHFIKGKNWGLVVGRQGQVVGSMEWNLIFIVDKISDLNLYYRGGGVVFPLYLYLEHFGQTEKVTNLNEAIVAKIAKGCNSLSMTPEQIFDYIYAVLHSPSYREKYREFLKIDFPRIPYPKDAEQFNRLSEFGKKLRHLHLMENITTAGNCANFPKSGSNKVENSFTEKSNSYQENKAWINDSQYFDNVPAESWNFYIGGYQPAQKWLKDRRGRVLCFDDIVHYQRIICVLKETCNIMREIDA
jgi:predicted helicase